MIDPLTALVAAGLAALVSGYLFWPESGLYFRFKRSRGASERVHIEDALKHIHKYEDDGRSATLESVAGAAQISLDEAGDIVAKMKSQGLLEIEGGAYTLTKRGREIALHVIRTHRLWERYLAEKTGFAQEEWHRRAEEQEHRISAEQANRLSAELGNPTHDPHGDPIPTSEGKMVPHGGRPLTALPLDRPLRIVHLEDEPEAVYAQLIAEGLHPGLTLRMTEKTPERVRFWADGDEHILAPVVAENISAVEAPREERPEESSGEPLSALHPGERARVASISPLCRGLERRRFMDLGILPGTEIEVERRSPGGDPTAYRVRGSTIALRSEQAGYINVLPEEKAS